MRRGGGTGRPTLGQATGGRPGQVRTPKAGYQHRGLGLGLNLKPGQARGFQQAAQGGQSGQWLAAHPGIQQRIGRGSPTGAQPTAIQNFMGTGQSQRVPRPPTTGPQRGGQSLSPAPPQTLGGMRGPQQDQFGAPGGLPFRPMPGLNAGMQSVLANRFGQGPPGGMSGWSGDNASMQGQLGAQAGGYNPPWGSTPDSVGAYAVNTPAMNDPGMVFHQGMRGQPAMGAPPQQAPVGGQQYASFGQPPRFQGMEGQPYGTLYGSGGQGGGGLQAAQPLPYGTLYGQGGGQQGGGYNNQRGPSSFTTTLQPQYGGGGYL